MGNFLALCFLNLLFLLFPGMLFFELITGNTAFFDMFRLCLSLGCFFLGFWAHDEFVSSTGDTFSDSRGIYYRIFWFIALISMASVFLTAEFSPINGFAEEIIELWRFLDIIVGGFLLFYFFERKIAHIRQYK
jgi:hypothetical protein